MTGLDVYVPIPVPEFVGFTWSSSLMCYFFSRFYGFLRIQDPVGDPSLPDLNHKSLLLKVSLRFDDSMLWTFSAKFMISVDALGGYHLCWQFAGSINCLVTEQLCERRGVEPFFIYSKHFANVNNYNLPLNPGCRFFRERIATRREVSSSIHILQTGTYSPVAWRLS